MTDEAIVVTFMDGRWMYKVELEKMRKYIDKLQARTSAHFFQPGAYAKFQQRHANKQEERYYRLAWIRVGRTLKMAYVDNRNTQKALKMENYQFPRIQMPYKRFIFVRWCTTMDI